MTVRYDEVLDPLRRAYDARAAWRDGVTKEPWKLAERQALRGRLAPGARLLEIGAGTGQDSAYFQEQGLAVVAADLSPVNSASPPPQGSTSWTSTPSTPVAATASSH